MRRLGYFSSKVNVRHPREETRERQSCHLHELFQGKTLTTYVQDDCEGTTVIRGIHASAKSKCNGSP
jgi:hypothetical protein